MNFVWNMAYRELRASWHRLLFFFLCIAVGVGSIVSLRSLIQKVSASVTSEARALMTADLQVSSNNQWSDETRTILERYINHGSVLGHTEIIEMPTMISAVNKPGSVPKLVELKAVQAPYPFYGQMQLAGGQLYTHSLLEGQGLLAGQSLLTQLELKVGDEVRLGKLNFTIRGVIEREPGNTMNAFSFGPRVMIDYADAQAAGLLSFGARARYRLLFKTREGEAVKLTRQLRRELESQPGVSVRSYRDSENRLAESLNRVEDYLSLIGLIILVLGGIGISSVTRVFVQQKMKTIAILKCLGGDNRRVLGAYLLQVLGLGLVGSLLGVLLAALTVYLVPRYLGDRIPLNIEYRLTWEATLQGLSIGLLISFLFSVLPLLEIRQIKPILLLRNDTATGRQRVDWVRLGVGASVLLALIGLASWQAGSLKIGGIFLGGLAVTALLLSLVASFLIHSLKQVRHIRSFVLRQGINSLYRPGNQTKIILMAVGLGAFFVIGVRSLQANLLDEFSLNLNDVAADMYLINIQKDQQAEVAALIKKATGAEAKLIPVVRARIVKVNNEDVKLERRRNPAGRGLLSREYTITYRPNLEENETIIRGKIWEPAPGSEPEISIEEALHNDLKLDLGDQLTFDIAGRHVTAKITSVRRVDWRNSRTGFLILFRPGSLEQAPQTLISAIKGPPPGQARAAFQRDLVDRSPNLSIIDVFDIVEVGRRILNDISLAVTFVGAFVFLAGVLILIGSIAMTKFHRLYEAAILKTLGAKKKLIIYTVLVEYGALGLLAGLIGSAAAVALTWTVCKYGLEIAWHFVPAINFIGVAVTVLLVTVVGVASSWDVMIKKPLGILRAE